LGSHERLELVSASEGFSGGNGQHTHRCTNDVFIVIFIIPLFKHLEL